MNAPMVHNSKVMMSPIHIDFSRFYSDDNNISYQKLITLIHQLLFDNNTKSLNSVFVSNPENNIIEHVHSKNAHKIVSKHANVYLLLSSDCLNYHTFEYDYLFQFENNNQYDFNPYYSYLITNSSFSFHYFGDHFCRYLDSVKRNKKQDSELPLNEYDVLFYKFGSIIDQTMDLFSKYHNRFSSSHDRQSVHVEYFENTDLDIVYRYITRINNNMNYYKTVVADQNKQDHICSICFDHFPEKEQVAILNCGHMYHITCIDEWFDHSKKSPSCPMCRKCCITI